MAEEGEAGSVGELSVQITADLSEVEPALEALEQKLRSIDALATKVSKEFAKMAKAGQVLGSPSSTAPAADAAPTKRGRRTAAATGAAPIPQDMRLDVDVKIQGKDVLEDVKEALETYEFKVKIDQGYLRGQVEEALKGLNLNADVANQGTRPTANAGTGTRMTETQAAPPAQSSVPSAVATQEFIQAYKKMKAGLLTADDAAGRKGATRKNVGEAIDGFVTALEVQGKNIFGEHAGKSTEGQATLLSNILQQLGDSPKDWFEREGGKIVRLSDMVISKLDLFDKEGNELPDEKQAAIQAGLHGLANIIASVPATDLRDVVRAGKARTQTQTTQQTTPVPVEVEEKPVARITPDAAPKSALAEEVEAAEKQLKEVFKSSVTAAPFDLNRITALPRPAPAGKREGLPGGTGAPVDITDDLALVDDNIRNLTGKLEAARGGRSESVHMTPEEAAKQLESEIEFLKAQRQQMVDFAAQPTAAPEPRVIGIDDRGRPMLDQRPGEGPDPARIRGGGRAAGTARDEAADARALGQLGLGRRAGGNTDNVRSLRGPGIIEVPGLGTIDAEGLLRFVESGGGQRIAEVTAGEHKGELRELTPSEGFDEKDFERAIKGSGFRTQTIAGGERVRRLRPREFIRRVLMEQFGQDPKAGEQVDQLLEDRSGPFADAIRKATSRGSQPLSAVTGVTRLGVNLTTDVKRSRADKRLADRFLAADKYVKELEARLDSLQGSGRDTSKTEERLDKAILNFNKLLEQVSERGMLMSSDDEARFTNQVAGQQNAEAFVYDPKTGEGGEGLSQTEKLLRDIEFKRPKVVQERIKKGELPDVQGAVFRAMQRLLSPDFKTQKGVTPFNPLGADESTSAAFKRLIDEELQSSFGLNISGKGSGLGRKVVGFGKDVTREDRAVINDQYREAVGAFLGTRGTLNKYALEDVDRAEAARGGYTRLGTPVSYSISSRDVTVPVPFGEAGETMKTGEVESTVYQHGGEKRNRGKPARDEALYDKIYKEVYEQLLSSGVAEESAKTAATRRAEDESVISRAGQAYTFHEGRGDPLSGNQVAQKFAQAGGVVPGSPRATPGPRFDNSRYRTDYKPEETAPPAAGGGGGGRATRDSGGGGDMHGGWQMRGGGAYPVIIVGQQSPLRIEGMGGGGRPSTGEPMSALEFWPSAEMAKRSQDVRVRKSIADAATVLPVEKEPKEPKTPRGPRRKNIVDRAIGTEADQGRIYTFGAEFEEGQPLPIGPGQPAHVGSSDAEIAARREEEPAARKREAILSPRAATKEPFESGIDELLAVNAQREKIAKRAALKSRRDARLARITDPEGIAQETDRTDIEFKDVRAQLRKINRVVPRRGFGASLTDLLTSVLGGNGFEEQLEKQGLAEKEAQELGQLTTRRTRLRTERRGLRGLADEQGPRGEAARVRIGEIDKELTGLGTAIKMSRERFGEFSKDATKAGTVLRSFTAAGIGGAVAGAVGTLQFGAALAFTGPLLEALGTAVGAGVEKLLGQPGITAEVTNAFSDLIRSAGGREEQAGAAFAQQRGLTTGQLGQLGPLTAQADIEAGNKVLKDQADALTAANRLSNAKSGLFVPTSGILGTSIGAVPSTDEILGNTFANIPKPNDAIPSPFRTTKVLTGVGRQFEEKRVANPEFDAFIDKLEDGERTLNFWNEALDKGGEQIVRFSGAAQLSPEARREQASQLDLLGAKNIANAVRDERVSLVNNQTGKAATSQEIVNALTNLVQGAPKADIDTILKQEEPQIRARETLRVRQRNLNLDTLAPSQLGIEEAANPSVFDPRTISMSATEQKKFNKEIGETKSLYADIAKEAAAGQQIAKNFVSEQLGPEAGEKFAAALDNVKSIGEDISKIQIGVGVAQADYATHQFNYQLKLAQRSMADLKALAGGVGSEMGRIERQQFLLQRESQALSLGFSQNQINFNKAIAGLNAPGLTGAERAARIEQAKREAEYAQKQLDIQKKLFNLGGRQFEVGTQRAIQDLAGQIRLLGEGRELNIKTAVAEKRIAALRKQQEKEMKVVNQFFQDATNKANDLFELEAKLIAATSKDLSEISYKVVTTYAKVYRGLIAEINKSLNPTSPQGSGGPKSGGPHRPESASGAVGLTPGTTDLGWSGEAGGEAVAILKNPKALIGGWNQGGGGNTVTVQIIVQGNKFTNEEEERRLVAAVQKGVERGLGYKGTMLGARRT